MPEPMRDDPWGRDLEWDPDTGWDPDDPDYRWARAESDWLDAQVDRIREEKSFG